MIENFLPYVRTVNGREVAGQAHRGSTPQALTMHRDSLLSLLRRSGYTNLASALRHFDTIAPWTLCFLGCSRPLT